MSKPYKDLLDRYDVAWTWFLFTDTDECIKVRSKLCTATIQGPHEQPIERSLLVALKLNKTSHEVDADEIVHK